jgi:outer membrane cobalamin receptor
LNLGLNWKLQPNLALLARINNLNDVNYVLANGYNMPGRNAYLSLTWSN